MPEAEIHSTISPDSHVADCAAVAYERPYPCDCGGSTTSPGLPTPAPEDRAGGVGL